MKILGFEIHRSKITDDIKTDIPVTDEAPIKKSTPTTVSYHLGQIYGRLDAHDKLFDTLRRDIQAAARATYRRPTNQDIEELFKVKNATPKEPEFRTGDPYGGN